MRPYFIIPGQEKKDFMKKICQKMDSEAKKCETFTIDIDGTEIKVTVEWHLGLDGKLIEMSTGLSKYLCYYLTYNYNALKWSHLKYSFLAFRRSTLHSMPYQYGGRS